MLFNCFICRDEYWELAAEGEKETLLQKYYRIKFETEELLQEYSFHEVFFFPYFIKI